jgi:hypothetical protein
MRHVAQPSAILAALALVVLGAAFPPAAAGRLADDDVILTVGFRNASGTTTGPSFKLDFNVETTAGVIQPVTLTVTLPDGLRWGADAPDPTEGCQGTAPAVCTLTLGQNGVGTVGVEWAWDVVADRPGTYVVNGTVVPSQSDPNPANNKATFQFEVTQPSSPDKGSVSVKATRATIAPAKPRAGSRVSATVHLTVGGTPVRPTGVRCTAMLGGSKIRGTARIAKGSATCRFATRRGAKGTLLRGSISVRVASKTVTRRFSTRLR